LEEKHLSTTRTIIVIGGNAAGINAANAARKQDSKANIILVTREKHPAYSRCGIPYVLANEIPRFEDLIIFPPSHYRMMRLDLRTETTATSIDTAEKTVQLEEKDGKPETVSYDALVLATGATPFIIPINGKDLPGVYAMRTLDDGRTIREAMKSAKSAVVIGAGFVGLETAHALVENHIQTTVVELLPSIVPTLFDYDMAAYAQKMIEAHGVKMLMGRRVTEILGDEKVTGLKSGDLEIETDMIIMATGVRPNVELARAIGCEVGITRTIRVNPRMQTTCPDVFAAGDCIESQSMITGLPCLVQLGTNAVRQGKVAGTNAAGGYSTFPGVICAAMSKIFDFEVGAAGLTEKQAQEVGFRTVSGAMTGATRAEYFPGKKEVRVKIIAEPYMGRVMGAQLVGGEGVAHRVNMLSIAIQTEMTVRQLLNADTGYAPPMCDTWEPVALAAEIAARKIQR
jgi:NADH oxidase (H2O2-forming)